MPLGIQNNSKDPFETFLDQLNEPREVIQEQVEIPEPSVSTTELVPEGTEPDPVMERKKAELAMIPAEVVVDVIDTTAISINSYIAKEPVEGATAEEKQNLQKAVANYLRETDIDISPGKLVLVLVLMIYGPKLMQAWQTRKQNIEMEAMRTEMEAQREFIKDLEAKLKNKEVNHATVPGV